MLLLQFHVGCVFSGDETARSQDTSECEKKTPQKIVTELISLGGGFIFFLFSPLPGEMMQFD